MARQRSRFDRGFARSRETIGHKSRLLVPFPELITNPLLYRNREVSASYGRLGGTGVGPPTSGAGELEIGRGKAVCPAAPARWRSELAVESWNPARGLPKTGSTTH